MTWRLVRASARVASLVLFFFACDSLQAQEPAGFSFDVTPQANIPVTSAGESFTFRIGPGVDLVGRYQMRFLPALEALAGVNYSLYPIQEIDNSISEFAFGVGGGYTLNLGSRLVLRASALGGLNFGFLNRLPEGSSGSNTGWSAYASGRLGAGFTFSPAFSVEAAAEYRRYWGLLDSVSVQLSAGITPGANTVQPADLRIEQIRTETLFPVFHTYYDEHPFGTCVLRNMEDRALSDLQVRVNIPEYMLSAKTTAQIAELEAGSDVSVDLLALIDDSIMEVVEASKTPLEIIVDYSFRETGFSHKEVTTVDLYGRNSLTWDDDRKAAAFVTVRDPAIVSYAKSVTRSVQDSAPETANQNFVAAMAMFNALSYHGMSYVIDPRTPYDEFSGNAAAVDYIEFPRRTLEDGAGDCDDLSILYASLLEAIGIGTAFVTVPGHIFAAVDLGISRAEARGTFASPDDLIYRDDQAWLPVEVTTVGDSFLAAWRTGARQWRRFSEDGKAALYAMDENWQHYDPVNLPTSNVRISIDDSDALREIHRADVDRWIAQEIRPREEELLARLERADSPATRTRLGVVYAQYGRLEDARAQFTHVVTERPYLPALLNLGTVYFLQHDYEQAANCYRQVLEAEPQNANALLGMARVSYEVEDYDATEEQYTALAELDPDLAQRFSYLDLRSDVSGRAADTDALHNAVVWEIPE